MPEPIYTATCLGCDWTEHVARTDEAAVTLVRLCREHAERFKHDVMLPFKIYERIGR